ncbi:MAG: M23 family metallopeptidase [Treponemataceae bacterium]|nr:M23 family metallopeptidase [Treponemataceae bacterium]
MKKMKACKKAALAVAAFFLAAEFSRAFEWPARNFSGENLNATFAQNRNGRFNSSQIFREVEEVTATDNGRLTIVIFEHQDGASWFESTLGNCAIVAHEDSLVSVYGNLDEKDADSFSKKQNIVSGTSIGKVGDSAWSDAPNSLEFQILDTSKKSILNPLILMPRVSSMQDSALDGITFENRLGRVSELSSTRSLQAGTYNVYKIRRDLNPTYSSTIYLNGMELETIVKDTLKMEGGLLAISGRRAYSAGVFYPDSSREFLGRIVIPHGNNTVTITVRNNLEKERSLTYNIQGN